MSIKTWVTRPPQKFDSFYYYDTVKLHCVRIRLELNRTTDPNPDPAVFPEQNRYVGFVYDDEIFDFDTVAFWTVNANREIVYKIDTPDEKILDKEPRIGKCPVDFSLPPGREHPIYIHTGNTIVKENEALLPVNSAGKRVTLAMLEIIASKLATSTHDRDLGSSTESEQKLGDKIFQLYEILIGSTASKNALPFEFQLREAAKFFNDPRYPAITEKDNPYADKDGLIEFIIGTELVDNPKVMEKLSALKKQLIALTSVVTDYVNRYAAVHGEKHKTDAELWALAMSKLPLMGPSKVDTQSYTRHIKGITIATEFVEFLLDIVTQDGSAALNRFSGFLQKQGEALRFGVEHNADFYNTITIGISIEVISLEGEIIYIPKIKQYKVNFDRKNSKWSGACVSYEYVDINFNYLYAANVFDYEALDDKDIKEAFDKFIKGQRKAQIEDSSTFFDADFLPKKPKLTAQTVQ